MMIRWRTYLSIFMALYPVSLFYSVLNGFSLSFSFLTMSRKGHVLVISCGLLNIEMRWDLEVSLNIAYTAFF